ncbi:MAG: hypothetical protein UY63_C0009G0018 [Parcubacteria group bacterium GW2011_GWA2_51_10]|nr:MAG: hypothetical protein UY63_C0009G0018 [Parcubacteria group bacterium GW2011_GWA2_51_10]
MTGAALARRRTRGGETGRLSASSLFENLSYYPTHAFGRFIFMARDYPLEKVRNFGIIAPIVAMITSLLENPRFSTGCALISFAGKLQFSRPLSHDVRNSGIFC